LRKLKKGKNQKIRSNPDILVVLVALNKVTEGLKIKEPGDTFPASKKAIVNYKNKKNRN
jgi:hypothetical protein